MNKSKRFSPGSLSNKEWDYNASERTRREHNCLERLHETDFPLAFTQKAVSHPIHTVRHLELSRVLLGLGAPGAAPGVCKALLLVGNAPERGALDNGGGHVVRGLPRASCMLQL